MESGAGSIHHGGNSLGFAVNLASREIRSDNISLEVNNAKYSTY